MNDEKIFADGVIFRRHDRAPDFVIGNLSIKMNDLIAFAKLHHKDGWLNLQIKKSRGGKYYVEKDTFEPKPREERQQPSQSQPAPSQIEDDDIPF